MKIRTLTITEKDTLKRALRELGSNTRADSIENWAAGIMITMVNDLLWVEDKGEING